MAASPDAGKVNDLDDHADLFDDIGPIETKDTTKQDDEDLQKVLNALATEGNVTGLEGFENKDIDQTDKADNAIDFEDLSDDDLASDEDVASQAGVTADASQVPGVTEDSGTSHDVDMEGDADLDDLFGDQDGGNTELAPSSPLHDTQPAPLSPVQAQKTAAATAAAAVTDDDWNTMSWEERFKLNFPQQEPNSVSAWVTDQTQHQDPSVPVPPQNVDELLKQKFPAFQEHKVLDFRNIFPEWPADYVYKEPPKSPAPLVPTKLELEIDVDTSKLFRIPDSALAATSKRSQQQQQQQQFGDHGQWGNLAGPVLTDLDDAFSDSDDENELVGGYTMTEIATICEDWENINEPPTSYQVNGHLTPPAEDEPMDDWDREFLVDRHTQPKKKRKYEPGLPSIASYNPFGISNFLEATKRAAHHVQLDQNDPYLLIEDMQVERPAKKARSEEKMRRMANGQLGRDVMHRFNHSNDAAYEALKANHKSKVRATLSNLDVEHSMPAQKLAFPFYRTKLNVDFWEHHRPKFDIARYIKYQIKFKKPAKVKRKELKGKPVPDVYKTSRDLSLNDNSNVVLFEYCEQAPILLNKFGMGSRVINYTRRQEGDEEDKLPKAELGETQTLLPEDKSPFSIFGTVDIGEVVPTLHNALYRAPVFKHEQRSNDFILGYSITAKDAPHYYLKKAFSLQVVGQQNVFQEVPGPHARMITSTNKKRMRAICDRMARHRPTQDIDIREVTAHVFDKVDPQNRYQPRDDSSHSRIDPNDRQKMKEFYVYDKESKTWKYKEGDAPMDERTIRQQIKPEDVVLIEATQVGSATLQNAGYDPKAPSFADDDDELATDIPLVAKLAPWELTKNFLDACQSKAMVALHGEGDPTGHGLGFSFIKTSMKGGYINAVQGPLATSADAIERERKANGGHSYNVKKQNEMYTAAIKEIWERQKHTLSDPTTHEDSDVLDTANEDDRFNPQKSADHTSAPVMDDGRSQLSRFSQNSRTSRRKLKIIRRKPAEDGSIYTETQTVDDPQVIRSYIKSRRELDAAKRDIYTAKPTGDADADRLASKLIEQELSRLEKNADRRQVREKQGKGKRKNAKADAGSPGPSGSADKAAGGTTRKCANCGQIGHIKTNKRIIAVRIRSAVICTQLRRGRNLELWFPTSTPSNTRFLSLLSYHHILQTLHPGDAMISLIINIKSLANMYRSSKCPLLNGTISTDNNAADLGGFGSFSAPGMSGDSA
ncbi:putative Transcription initiation factor TFIID subunit 1 histone acetyltransferase domain-containing protein [Seiridium cardinale]